MTLRQLENRLDAQRMVQSVARHAARSIERQALASATKHSSGTWSVVALRRMGHPYRAAGPNPLDPGTINAQRGVFRSAWRMEGPIVDGARIVMYLVNDSDVADYMLGTRRMVQRPVWQKISDDMQLPLSQAILNGVEAYWRK